MADIKIKTAKRVVPMIYAYTTPEIARHNGWTKIGYTEQTVEKRLKQQAHTVDVIYHEEWKGNAVYDDGSGEIFSDKDFHVYLRKLGVENNKANEWFHIDGQESQKRFFEFRSNRGMVKSGDTVIPYTLRKEQAIAVEQTERYFKSGRGKEYLWNAKPRFGKTLSVYELCKKMEAQNVLIVTNRPAIANSWYSDYVKFLGTESGYQFVSNTDSLKGKKLVVSREDYVKVNSISDSPYNCIEFVSLQDLKGSLYFGGDHDKLKEVADMEWDLLVIDEAHEGVDTYKTDVAFEHISRKYTLHLSGTPFKALANDKFPDNAIFNWTYADEQSAKCNWNSQEGNENPYATLPQLNMLTYQMSEIIRDDLEQGIEIQGETEEYAFDLNLFFETKNGQFIHDSSVDKFLDAMTTQTKFPFSTEELQNELKHTFWLLNRVDSAKALAKKLEQHPIFGEYKIILAAGDGVMDGAGLDSEEESKKSFDKVVSAVKNYEKTITLSVGQLTTGVTIPEWTAVLMLSNMKSPSLYMQAAFRAQNPCLFSQDGEFYRKKNAYVFDFDPARTLTIFEGKIEQTSFIAVKNDDHGVLNVKGGEIIGGNDTENSKAAILNWKTANISGGTVKGAVVTRAWSDEVVGNTTISSDAKVEGAIKADKYGNATAVPAPTVAIKGGTLDVTEWIVEDEAKVEINVEKAKFIGYNKNAALDFIEGGKDKYEIGEDGKVTEKTPVNPGPDTPNPPVVVPPTGPDTPVTPPTEIEDPDTPLGPLPEEEVIAAVKAMKITASSKAVKGKITVKWKVKGNTDAIDGYRVYKSTKKDKGFKFMGKTKKLSMANKKNLKKGTRYFYKVRAYKVLDSGKVVYSDYSNLANRYAK